MDAHNAPIAPKISGNIVEILVDDNQMVKAGQVLVRVDPRDYQAKVDQARAALAVAESQSVGAHAGVPLTDGSTASAVAAAESQLAAAVADSARAKADYDRASTSELAYAQADVDSKRATKDRALADLARMQPLVAKDEISKLQYDSYLAAARVAESDLKASQENLVNARKKAESSRDSMLTAEARANAAMADVDQARVNRRQVQISSAQAGSASASIQQARANLEAAELQLSYTSIVAPDRWSGHKEDDSGWPDCSARPDAAHHRAAEAGVGDRQFQRDPACESAAGSARGSKRGYVWPLF